VQTAWPSLGSALEIHWLVLCEPLLSSYAQMSCTAPVSSNVAFILVWASICQLSAVIIASSLMSGCGLSHKCVEDSFKSICVKFGAENQQNWGNVSFIYVYAKSVPQKKNLSGNGLNPLLVPS